MVSRSSINDTIEMMAPIMSIMMSRFSRRGEKSAKRNKIGLMSMSVRMIDIPAPYGAGALHFSVL